MRKKKDSWTKFDHHDYRHTYIKKIKNHGLKFHHQCGMYTNHEFLICVIFFQKKKYSWNLDAKKKNAKKFVAT